jgi:hypothetical protein
MELACNSITAIGTNAYEVALSLAGSTARTFVFIVDDRDGICVVVSPPEFAAMLQHQMGGVEPLYELVLAFHHTRRLKLP